MRADAARRYGVYAGRRRPKVWRLCEENACIHRGSVENQRTGVMSGGVGYSSR